MQVSGRIPAASLAVKIIVTQMSPGPGVRGRQRVTLRGLIWGRWPTPGTHTIEIWPGIPNAKRQGIDLRIPALIALQMSRASGE